MIEKQPNVGSGSEGGKGHEVHFTRHSKAGYETYGRINASENPEAPVNVEDQVIPDVPEKGIELAQEKAAELFKDLDPKTDILFFASSSEARALETANVYRHVAQELGFEIIKPEHTGTELAGEIGEGDIRAVESLSLNIDNTLLSSIFNPESHLGKINWDAVDKETREKWDQARAIINADDKGSWGANFFHHSREVKKIFPEIEDTEEVYNGKFQRLIRLVQFGLKKAEKANLQKNVKILAFGHENYMGYALDKYFGDHGLNNCETITVRPEGDDLVMKRRDQTATIE